jgi:hypothetical protein
LTRLPSPPSPLQVRLIEAAWRGNKDKPETREYVRTASDNLFQRITCSDEKAFLIKSLATIEMPILESISPYFS